MNAHSTLWCDNPSTPNQHVAFRGTWVMSVAADVTCRLLGASWFVVWIDGECCAEGPARFLRAYPEYQELKIPLPTGSHLLAISEAVYRMPDLPLKLKEN